MAQMMGPQAPTLSKTPQISPKQGIYEQSADPICALGTEIWVGDRKFIYCKASSSGLSAGKLAVTPDVVANHLNCAAAAASAIGSTSVTLTMGATAVTANQYADGYLAVNDATGEGYTYRIKSNPAADASATCVFTLYDPIQVALVSATSECSVYPNIFNGIQTSVADQADIAVGVAPIAVTASYYFWCQVKGPCAVLQDESVTHESQLTIGTSTVGAVEAVDADAEQVIGYTLATTVDTEYNLIYLNTYVA